MEGWSSHTLKVKEVKEWLLTTPVRKIEFGKIYSPYRVIPKLKVKGLMITTV